ncbi:MAG: hypothetical protein Q8O10_02795 [candidate division Zixibacteria bacterium]|nr:hypothetical protein [candidate division Zixibacteria bacterium]
MGNQLESLLPQKVKDFEKSDKAKSFDRKNLYDYLDGGAELYLAYDFQSLLVQDYKAGEKSITVEVYLMETSQDAFGLYSLDQEGENIQIGDRANYGSGLLNLWKGNYFVRITDMNGNDQYKEAILQLGKDIESKIEIKGQKPKLLSKLPPEGLIPNSQRFFHKQIVLNNLYFIATENLLNLNESTSAVMGDYLLGKMNLKLLLISYPDSSSAKSSFDNFCTKYLKVSPASKRIIQKVEENKFVGLELEKNYLWITFESKDEKKTGTFLKNVREKLR